MERNQQCNRMTFNFLFQWFHLLKLIASIIFGEEMLETEGTKETRILPYQERMSDEGAFSVSWNNNCSRSSSKSKNRNSKNRYNHNKHNHNVQQQLTPTTTTASITTMKTSWDTRGLGQLLTITLMGKLWATCEHTGTCNIAPQCSTALPPVLHMITPSGTCGSQPLMASITLFTIVGDIAYQQQNH